MRSLAVLVVLVAPIHAAAQAEIFENKGCLGCHSVDGTSRSGPTFAGIADRHDEAYLRRALLEPSADVPDGYAPMPDMQLSEADTDALVAALLTLEPVDPPFESLWPLLISCVLFVGLHFLLSGPLRSSMAGKLGEAKFQGVYSLMVALPFGGIFWGWSVAPHVGVWHPPIFTIHLAVTLMFLSVLFIVAGYTTKSPTVAGTNVHLEAPTGILTVTRHPALWGFALWALAHLGANGDAASLILFGSFAVLSFGGMLHIDHRRRASDSSWAKYEAQTSVIPFAAIARRRTRLSLKGLWWQLLISLVVYATIVLWSHEWLMGVSPLPLEMQRLLP